MCGATNCLLCLQQLCGANTECIFDAVVAGLTVGAATLAAGDEFQVEVQAVGGGECVCTVASIDQPFRSDALC